MKGVRSDMELPGVRLVNFWGYDTIRGTLSSFQPAFLTAQCQSRYTHVG